MITAEVLTEMAHDHDHEHAHHHSELGDIRLAFFLNLVFTVFEIMGGLWTNSLAIMANAIHDLGDSFALGSAWFLERLSAKKGDSLYSYGYRRFSLLGALITAAMLVAGSSLILFKAVPRLIHPLIHPQLPNAQGMVLFAVIGIMVNGAAVIRLKGSKGMNAKMVAWHLLEDVLGWTAVLAISIVLLIREIPVLDPLLSCVITLYVLFNVLKNLGKTIGIFMQGVPEGVDITAIEESMRAIKHVTCTHHTHIWSLDGMHHVLTTHVVVDQDATQEDIMHIKENIRYLMITHGMNHSTVEIEYCGEECRISGDSCNCSS
ncbi:MAG TPA: cation diffusion facilitator family transporter [Desulfomonilia bacterium]|nr:cation diffusion facilitator family transporter [Desulfomonilia bacterium]